MWVTVDVDGLNEASETVLKETGNALIGIPTTMMLAFISRHGVSAALNELTSQGVAVGLSKEEARRVSGMAVGRVLKIAATYALTQLCVQRPDEVKAAVDHAAIGARIQQAAAAFSKSFSGINPN